MDLPDNETLKQLAEAEQAAAFEYKDQTGTDVKGFATTGESSGMGPYTQSEVMAKRDNFFHSCWMRMKQLHLDMARDMTEIELYIANLPIGPEVEEDEPDEDDTIL